MKKSFFNSLILILIYLIIYPGNNYAQAKNESDIEMVIQRGHTGIINNLIFSPDGKYIITSGSDNKVNLWSIDGKLIRTHKRTYYKGSLPGLVNKKILFSPDSKYFAFFDRGNEIKLYDIRGELIKTFNGLYNMAFTHDGKYVVTRSKKVIVFMNMEGEQVGSIETGHKGFFSAFNLSPDDKYVVFVYRGSVEFWSIDGVLIKTFKLSSIKNKKRVSKIYFNIISSSHDGKYIAYGVKEDNSIKLYNMDGKFINTFKGHSGHITSVAFSPDGKYIASGSLDMTIKLWNMEGKLIKTFKENTSQIFTVSFSPDSKCIASGGSDGVAKLWDINGKFIRELKGYPGKGKFVPITKVMFNPDRTYIALGTQDGLIKILRYDGKLIRIFKVHSDTIGSLSLSHDGKYIAYGAKDNSIKLYNIDGKLINTFKGHFSHITSIAFSPDSKYLAFGTGDNKVNLWSINGKFIRTFKGHLKDISSVAISPDSKNIVSGSGDGAIKLWSIEGEFIRTLKEGKKGARRGVRVRRGKMKKEPGRKTKKPISYISGRDPDPPYSITFSSDGKYIAFGIWGTIGLYSIDGKSKRTIGGPYPGETYCVSFSPDGKYIAAGMGDNTVILWSRKDDLIKTFKSHTSFINDISFSPDGKFIASCSSDGTVKLWNIETENCITYVSSEEDWIVYASDGYFDASRTGGGLVGMTKGVEAFGVDQFAIRKNRPDIILNRVGLGTPEQIKHFYNQYKKRLKRMGIKEDQLSKDYHVPEVEILETKQDGKYLEVVFKFSDKKYDLKKCNIYINDVPRYKGYGKNISGRLKKFKVKLELTSGKNKIEITCINEKGAESFRALTYAEYNEKVKGDLYYIGFGVSKYKDGLLNLKYADKDAEDLAGLFSNLKGKFNNIHTKTYLNEEVTKENIKNAKKFLKNSKVDDTFILFIAGHGIHSRDEEATYYYLTHNADINNLSQTAANFDLLENLMQGIQPRNKLFLIDTCESGEIEEDTRQQYFAMADTRGIKARTTRALTLSLKNKRGKTKRTYLFDRDRYIYNDLMRRSGAIVFSSSCGGEFSYEKDEYQNGLFTEAIIKSLSGNEADENSDGIISTDELRNYVIKTVPEFSDNLQHPTVDRDNIYQKFGFPISRADKYTVKKSISKAKREKKATKNKYETGILRLNFTPDSKYIMSGTGDSTIRIWNINGELTRKFKGNFIVDYLSFSPDGKYIVSGDLNKLRLWSIDGKLIRRFEGSPYGGSSVASSFRGNHRISFMHNSKYVAAVYSRAFKLWSLNGEIVKSFNLKTWIKNLLFSPDDRYLIILFYKDKTIKFLNLNGKLVKTLNVNDDIECASFSPDGKYIATGSSNGLAEIWSIDGELIRTLGSRRGTIASILFSHDGKYIAFGDYGSKLVKVFDFNGNLIGKCKGASNDNIIFSPDGKYIASGGSDGVVKLYSKDGKFIRAFKDDPDSE